MGQRSKKWVRERSDVKHQQPPTTRTSFPLPHHLDVVIKSQRTREPRRWCKEHLSEKWSPKHCNERFQGRIVPADRFHGEQIQPNEQRRQGVASGRWYRSKRNNRGHGCKDYRHSHFLRFLCGATMIWLLEETRGVTTMHIIFFIIVTPSLLYLSLQPTFLFDSVLILGGQ